MSEILSQVSLVLHVKCTLFLPHFNEICILSSVSKNVQIAKLMKFRPMTAELIPCGRRNIRTDMTKLKATFLTFVIAPNN